MISLEEERKGVALAFANPADNGRVGNYHATLTRQDASRSHLARSTWKSPPLAARPVRVHCRSDLNQSSMTAPDDIGTTAVPPASTKPASLWEDFIDIFVSPSEVFERRRASGFIAPLLVFAILTVVITLVGRGAMQPIFDSEFTRGMAAAAKKNPQLTQAQMEGPRAFMEKLTPVFIGLGALIMPMLVGVILWLAGKIVDAKEDIGAACMIAAYALIPRVLDSLLRVVQAFVLDPATLNGQYRVALSPARFLDPDVASPVMIALLGRIDLFTIWVTVLLAIGLAVVARIPRSRAAIAAVVVWVIGSLPAVLAALRAS